jgi:HEPN superfamily RiboL-PSP-like protein
MPSIAREAFDKNAEDVKRLLAIHADVGGDAKGRRFGLEVLNKSAIVLITAIWEAYCEDIADEALEHLITHAPSGATLPKELKKRIIADIKADVNELAMWDLADAGWKGRVRARLSSLTAERNRRLNTPKSSQIDELFSSAIGLVSVSDSWKWKRMSSGKAQTKLDNYVTLRGAIAHRGAGGTAVLKWQVEDYFGHVQSLASKTEDRVKAHVRGVTRSDPW